MRSRSVSYAIVIAVSFAGACQVAFADYRSAVTVLTPTHYWRLDETTGSEGTIAVNSTGGVNGTYAGFIEPGLGEIGVEGPPVNIASGNLAFNANDNASIDIGPGAAMAAPTMTIAMWFKENGSQGGIDSGPTIKLTPTPVFKSSLAEVLETALPISASD